MNYAATFNPKNKNSKAYNQTHTNFSINFPSFAARWEEYMWGCVHSTAEMVESRHWRVFRCLRSYRWNRVQNYCNSTSFSPSSLQKKKKKKKVKFVVTLSDCTSLWAKMHAFFLFISFRFVHFIFKSNEREHIWTCMAINGFGCGCGFSVCNATFVVCAKKRSRTQHN